MNVEQNTNTTDGVVAETAITDVKHFYIDAEGARHEIPFDVSGDGEASLEETTVYVATDAADHRVDTSVTVH